MSAAEARQKSPPGKRRWYQYSLRTLLLFMLLASIGMSWFAIKLQKAREQRAAVAAITQAGGAVLYGGDSSPRDVTQSEDRGRLSPRSLFGDDLFDTVVEVWVDGDQRLRGRLPAGLFGHLKRLPGLRRLSLHSWDLAAEDMRQIGELNRLEQLSLFASRVPQEGWQGLRGLSRLTELDLVESSIGDAALVNLGGLSNLQRLYLSSTEITDAGLEHLRGLSNLESLELAGCKITDNGLCHLQGLSSLRSLDVSFSKVTAAGWPRLRQLPHLEELRIPLEALTDQSLADLRALRNLRFLELDWCTPDAPRKLEAALPGVQVSAGAFFGGAMGGRGRQP